MTLVLLLTGLGRLYPQSCLVLVLPKPLARRNQTHRKRLAGRGTSEPFILETPYPLLGAPSPSKVHPTICQLLTRSFVLTLVAGSAVYVFGIDLTGQAEIDFALDNITNIIHKHHYTGTQQFAYHAPFFSATGLTSDQMHTVYWGLKTTGNAVQFALFDYAIVTSGEDGMPTTGAVASSGYVNFVSAHARN
jgi:hypothetical protein